MIRGWIDRFIRCWLLRRPCRIETFQDIYQTEGHLPHKVITQWRCTACGRVWEHEWRRKE